ncbi:helix-turn-helix protein [Myroides sp. A21]|uniref:helix-turn-helix domain-containing protein n=1 Tax=Myroides sp. A21 TaxID=1583100 RepID=UPI00057CD0F0|nr:helix-turn-helix transcriptional regulator [Myroides sp. A21]AJA69643.1 helix-turn-helix protein [Myroides sp. A21]
MKKIPLAQVIDEQIGKKETRDCSLFDAQVEIERLGYKIYELRKARGLTKKELAQVAGVSKAEVTKVEGDNCNVKIITVLKLLNTLGVKLTWEIEG